MMMPQIALIPLRHAIASDQPTTLDLLITVTPPTPVVSDLKRPPLNLGLAIDRSGSMSGDKIDYARQAAVYAVEQLLPSDRISVTIFDDQVQCLVPSTLATNKPELVQQIRRIQPGGSTALHAGWVESGIQVSQHLNPEHLNRVILLSDGLANVGETNPDAIATQVHGLAKRGVSTTTMGVGNDYDEDLLEAIARSGDGNFYHIESPGQLSTIFQAELQGLMTTLGTAVTLAIQLVDQVSVIDVLNDFDRTSEGQYKLPNLLMGNSISIVVRLKIPALSAPSDLCTFRLAWDNPQQSERSHQQVTLNLPVVKAAQLTDFPVNEAVQQQVALLMAARARQEAIQQMDQGNYQAAQQSLLDARAQIMAAPASPMMVQEQALLGDLAQDLRAGDVKKSRKKALFQTFNRRRSKEDLT